MKIKSRFKKLNTAAIALPILLLPALLSFSAFAVEDIPDGSSETSAVETVAEETEIYTEDLTEAPPETEEPTEATVSQEPITEEETEIYTEERTEAPPATEQEQTAQEQAAESYSEQETTYWYAQITDLTTVDPTQLSTSTVSMKSYETGYTAGIVSLVCVIVGTAAISAVLISTKRGGKKSRRSESSC